MQVLFPLVYSEQSLRSQNVFYTPAGTVKNPTDRSESGPSLGTPPLLP